MSKADKVLSQLTLNIGKTKSLLEDGYSITDIAIKLGKNESTIRSYVSMIEEADVIANKN